MNENMTESVLVYSLGHSGRREEIFEQGKWSNDFQKCHVRFCRVAIRATYLSTFLLSVPKHHIKHYKWKFIILLADSCSKDSEVTVQCGTTVSQWLLSKAPCNGVARTIKKLISKANDSIEDPTIFYFLFWWWASEFYHILYILYKID